VLQLATQVDCQTSKASGYDFKTQGKAEGAGFEVFLE
jgi:hypothetical protein